MTTQSLRRLQKCSVAHQQAVTVDRSKGVQRHRGPTQAPAESTYETYVVSTLLLLEVLCEAAAAVEEGDPAQNSSAGSAASAAATNSTERDAGGQSSEASGGGDEGIRDRKS